MEVLFNTTFIDYNEFSKVEKQTLYREFKRMKVTILAKEENDDGWIYCQLNRCEFSKPFKALMRRYKIPYEIVKSRFLTYRIKLE